MPRRINPKCLACAQLSATVAQQQHGPDGDSCWDEKVCPRRRSHYRHRRDNNSKRRAQYREQVAQAEAKVLTEMEIPLSLPPVAYLYLYREKRKDAPLHALAAAVWQGDVKVLDVKPIHCAGLRNRQIQAYLTQVLARLGDRYGITKFEPKIRLEPTECPIANCALRHSPTEGIDPTHD
ncbi:MAG: hypothetical protein F6K04_15110 [Leptolyngbya sp. SIO4C5]|nr:hypothetical protein [Leptolyngbya sp. SIO4C5]